MIHQFKIVYRTIYRFERIQLINKQREKKMHNENFIN